MVDLVCVCVYFSSPYIWHTLSPEFALLLRLRRFVHSLSRASLPENKAHLMQPDDVIRREPCTTVNVCFSCPPRRQNTHILSVSCKLKLSRLSSLWISPSHALLSILVLSIFFPSYPSTYLDVFSERVVTKLFCIYFRLNTQILPFYVFVWIYFILFFFLLFLSSSVSTHHQCVGDTNVTFSRRLCFQFELFSGNSNKSKIY